MGYALVGSLGAVAQSTSGGAVTGLAYGQTPTANNLLVAWWQGQASGTLPTTPTGWTLGPSLSLGGTRAIAIYFTVAAGSDAVPTFGAITGSTQTVMLGEFSGNSTNAASVLDQSATANGTVSPIVATAAGADAAAGELIISAAHAQYTTAAAATLADTFNNGATANETTNNAAAANSHYCFGWGVTTGNASADSDSFSFSGAPSNTLMAIASFKLAPVTAPTFLPPPRWLPLRRGIRDLRSMRRYTPRAAPSVAFIDTGSGALILGGSLTSEGPVLFTPPHGRRLPLLRGIRDLQSMRRYAPRAGAAVVPVFFTDAPTGTLILGGSVTGEGPVLFTPPHGRQLPLARGIRDLQSMRRYTRANSFTAPLFVDARTGALIFGGTASEGTTFSNTRTGTLIFGGTALESLRLPLSPAPPHGRQMPLLRGIRDRPAMRRYAPRSSTAHVPALFTDVRSGTLIFRGASTETNTLPAGPTKTVTIGTFFKVGP